MSVAHMVLFEKFRILHHDISINNTMIYVADVPESEGDVNRNYSGKSSNDGSLNTGHHCSEALGDEAVDNQEDKHAQWDRERRQQIRDGMLRSGLLIDFDYATDLDQAPSVVSGDRTVRVLLILHIFTDEVQSGNDSIHVNQYPSQL